MHFFNKKRSSKGEEFLLANYIVQFPLKVEKFQQDILEKRFRIGREIYNSLLGKMWKRYCEMIKRREYRALLEEIAKTEKKKPLYKKLEAIRKESGFTEYAFHKEVKNMQKFFKKNIDSFTAQKIATQVWRAFEKMMYGSGERVHFKKEDEFKSLEGKSNGTGIRYMDGYIDWKGLRLKVLIDEKNHYEKEALKREIAYCRLIRKEIRERLKYYTQIVFKGVPPREIDKKTGEYRERIGSGEIRLRVGKQYLVYEKDGVERRVELADRVYPLEVRRRELIKEIKRRKERELSTTSVRHRKLLQELKEVYRKQTAVRKYQHECLSNEILKLGDRIEIDKIESVQEEIYSLGKEKRVKITTNGEIGNRAPKMFVEILERKVRYKNGE